MRGSIEKMTHFLSKSEKLSSLQINRHLSITPSVDSTCQIRLNTKDAETFKTETYLAVKTFQQDLKFHNESLKITNKQSKSWHLWFNFYENIQCFIQLTYQDNCSSIMGGGVDLKGKQHKYCIANHKLISFQWLDPWWLLQSDFATH